MSLNNDDIKQLIAILQRGLSDDNESVEENESLQEKPKKKKKPSATKPSTKSKFQNKFLDMAESNMHKDDVEIDRKLTKYPPTPRTRQFIPLSVVCRVCGRHEKVNPAIVESADRYKCNKCSSSAG